MGAYINLRERRWWGISPLRAKEDPFRRPQSGLCGMLNTKF
jgi:hypothetical protein